jgi:uridine monophosphate synthetase
MASRELVLSEEVQWKLAAALYDNGLFGVKAKRAEYVILKSKRPSPHYLDIRPGLSSFATRHLIAGTMADLAVSHTGKANMGVDYVVGSPEAMTSYATSIADEQRMGLLQPRVAKDKATGNKTPILGRYKEGERVSAFDDVITDGDTKIDTIESLRKGGLEVVDYFVVLDREEGGAPQVAETTGIEITPALGVSSMVRMLTSAGLFDQVQYDNVARYLTEYGDPHARELMNTAL